MQFLRQLVGQRLSAGIQACGGRHRQAERKTPRPDSNLMKQSLDLRNAVPVLRTSNLLLAADIVGSRTKLVCDRVMPAFKDIGLARRLATKITFN
jgi:hypothetical protein